MIKVTYNFYDEYGTIADELTFYTTWDGLAKTIGYNNYLGMENVAEKANTGNYMVHINKNICHIRQYGYIVWNKHNEKVVFVKSRDTAIKILNRIN